MNRPKIPHGYDEVVLDTAVEQHVEYLHVSQTTAHVDMELS